MAAYKVAAWASGADVDDAVHVLDIPFWRQNNRSCKYHLIIN